MSEENGLAQPPSGVGLDGLRAAAADCRACELWKPATQTVFGEGPVSARIVFVGEQPGDQEDRKGEPFVGPAGKLLDRALGDAGIDRDDAYVTNAVKHFRFTVKGKRRIHQTPGPEHLRACRPWLEAEFVVLKPEVVVCLGATAAKALISPSFRITKDRGQLLPWTPPGADGRRGGRRGRGRAVPDLDARHHPPLGDPADPRRESRRRLRRARGRPEGGRARTGLIQAAKHRANG